MTNKNLFNFIKYLILVGLLSGASGIVNAYDFSSGVFEFQQKLAKKGNSQAQYKLGNMYENGQGVKVNLNEASKWYAKSAAQNNASAKMRLTYIDVKKNGYKKAKHQNWLKKLQKDAAAKDGESLLLLATMHKKGIVVRKDLKKSSKLFKSASIRNVPGAETELEAVNTQIYNNKYNQQQKAKKRQAQKEKTQKDKAKQDKARKDKQLAQERKKASEQRKKQQAALRDRQLEEDRKARQAADKKSQEKLSQEQSKQEEQRRIALAAEQAKADKEKAKKEAAESESDPLVDKSRCKGKKARFLTMCR